MSRGPTTHSLDERIDALAEDMKELTRSVRDFGNDLLWIKRIGAFVAALLVAAGIGSGRLIWDASALNSDVKQQGGRLEKIEGRLDGIDGRLDRVERRLDRVEGRLDGIDGRLDAIGKQLDTLLSRTAPKPAG